MLIWHVLDFSLLIFHAALTVFNLFGWLIRPWRKLNLITLLLTGGSWFILGIFFGTGYCPLTDLHWNVLHKLGVTELPVSYISYLLDRAISVHFPDSLVEFLTALLFFLALVISVTLNTRDYLLNRKSRPIP
jgi:hypothetical protein